MTNFFRVQNVQSLCSVQTVQSVFGGFPESDGLNDLNVLSGLNEFKV